MARRSAPPLWFLLCVAVALALALRLALGAQAGAGVDGARAPEPLQAWFAFVVLIAQWIYRGVEVAARVTLSAVALGVKALWYALRLSVNALKTFGHGLLVGVRKAWDFFQFTYDHVIKPFIAKVWRWLERAKAWLDDTFRPVFEFLHAVRDNLLAFYNTFVRPWLDLIDITRRVLRIAGSLGLSWARELDRRLGELQDLIERPFRYLLAKVNEIVNIVNRIVTADGLFQRLVFLKTLKRDYKQAWGAITGPYSRPVTHPAGWRPPASTDPPSIDAIEREYVAALRGTGGANAAQYRELATFWRAQLARRP
jgi:hypothetical protein